MNIYLIIWLTTLVSTLIFLMTKLHYKFKAVETQTRKTSYNINQILRSRCKVTSNYVSFLKKYLEDSAKTCNDFSMLQRKILCYDLSSKSLLEINNLFNEIGIAVDNTLKSYPGLRKNKHLILLQIEVEELEKELNEAFNEHTKLVSTYSNEIKKFPEWLLYLIKAPKVECPIRIA